MSYPQPLASQEVIEGQEFFRLFTPLESGADIYELDVSAKAFAIGPQSDIGAVRVTYYDPSQPARSSSFVVSVASPFLGRIDAFASAKYKGSNGPARILVSPENLYNNLWFPTVDASDIVSYIRPKIDLQAYLQPPTTVSLKRADTVIRGRLTIIDRGAGTGVTWFVVPLYRRRSASISIRAATGGSAGYTVDIDGINFSTDGIANYVLPSDFIVSQTSLVSGGAVAAGAAAVTEFTYKASTDGTYDYMLVSILGPAIDGSAVVDTLRYTIQTQDEE